MKRNIIVEKLFRKSIIIDMFWRIKHDRPTIGSVMPDPQKQEKEIILSS